MNARIVKALFVKVGRIRKVLGALALLFSSAILLWGLWPSQEISKNLILQDLSPGTNSATGPARSSAQRFLGNNPVGLSLSGSGAVLEPRRSTLSWIEVVRKGDSQAIHLHLVDAGEQAGGAANLSGGVYADYNILAEARLDMAGVEVIPRDTISQPMLPGEPVSFFWTTRSDHSGEYQGTVWLYFHFIPLDENAQESQRAISAQNIQIRTVDLLGMGGRTARIAGLCGFLLGLYLVIDRQIFQAIAMRFHR